MGNRTKKVVIALVVLSLVLFGIRFSADQWNAPSYPSIPWQRLKIEDLTPAPPGTGPDGLYATWAAVRFDGLGEHGSGSAKSGMRLTFTKEKLVWAFDTPDGKKVYDGIYHIAPDRNPKEIDFGEPNQPAPEKMIHGFYEVKEDKLIIWGPAVGAKAGADADSFRLELKRVLPRP